MPHQVRADNRKQSSGRSGRSHASGAVPKNGICQPLTRQFHRPPPTRAVAGPARAAIGTDAKSAVTGKLRHLTASRPACRAGILAHQGGETVP
jgi:hypothetical protein